MRSILRELAQLSAVLLTFVLIISSTPLVQGSSDLVVYSPILGIKSEPKKFSVPLVVINLLDEAREVSFEISHPKDWICSLLYRDYGVSKIFLRGRESMNLTLTIEPSPNVTAGSYDIVVTALSSQAKSSALKIEIEIVKPSTGIELTTTSAEVTGSPGSVFSFRFDIKNNYYRDLTFRLSAEVPEDWQNLGFKPSPYETKVISDVTVRARSTYWGTPSYRRTRPILESIGIVGMWQAKDIGIDLE
jgi:uncharacterized membrane protein